MMLKGGAMCGRFVGFRKLEALKPYFPIDATKCETLANYNVAPRQQVLAIASIDGTNVLDQYHWGLVPFWAEDITMGSKLINARVETVATKPSFRDAFKKRRCLILADGFYEWTGRKGAKQPMLITLPDQAPFAFAGLWEIWQNQQNPIEIYQSCTMITREAIGVVKKLHHRMPVILKPEAYTAWLTLKNPKTDLLCDLLNTKSISDLVFHPVSRQVNSVRYNDPTNIKPVQIEFDF